MVWELAVLVFFNYLFYQKLRLNLYLSSFLAILIGRVLYLLVLFVVAELLHIPKMTFTLYAAIKPIPGLVLLVVVVPTIVFGLKKIPFFAEMGIS
jgi:hypothetical protein